MFGLGGHSTLELKKIIQNPDFAKIDDYLTEQFANSHKNLSNAILQIKSYHFFFDKKRLCSQQNRFY